MTLFKAFNTFLQNINSQIKYHSDNNTDFLNRKLTLKQDALNKLFFNIVVDKYAINDKSLKLISTDMINTFNIHISKLHKALIKEYLDYKNEKVLKDFFDSLIDENVSYEEIKKIINKYFHEDITLDDFQSNITEKKDRLEEYCEPILSKAINILFLKQLTLEELYSLNKISYEKELEPLALKNIKSRITGDLTQYTNRDAVYKLNIYLSKELGIDSNSSNNFQLAIVKFSQNDFNKFKDYDKFLNFCKFTLEETYSVLSNHRMLAIHIENIVDAEINVKWKLYSDLVIFAENFKTKIEEAPYYKPHEMFIDYIEHFYGLYMGAEKKEEIKKVYKNKEFSSFKKDNELGKIKNIVDLAQSFLSINYGYTYIDNYILVSDKTYQQTEQLKHTIDNHNEICILLQKHQLNKRKIPCPECASLQISGNSFPEVGIRSWECKNNLCPSRSKTNRGKRYSYKSNMMQNSHVLKDFKNLITKTDVKKWRKDVLFSVNIDEFYEMQIKYYSYSEDNILFIGTKYNLDNKGRIIHHKTHTYEEISTTKTNEIDYLNRFLKIKIKHDISKNKIEPSRTFEEGNIKVIKGNASDVLPAIKNISGMVTSPPYYNAREYSQWSNIWCYYYDMHDIIKKAYESLTDGGVFVFNIGDIFSNENTIVKSKMGDRKIALGAYLIKIFEDVGFSLLDNIIWYKNEPQTNRHKNAGNYIPFYQKPANCYEHIFIFYKKGLHPKINKLEKKISNIMPLTPVFKMFNGENKVGHTAPFPKEIPELLINNFLTEEDVLLEPFTGSGTSLLAAYQHNISFYWY